MYSTNKPPLTSYKTKPGIVQVPKTWHSFNEGPDTKSEGCFHNYPLQRKWTDFRNQEYE